MEFVLPVDCVGVKYGVEVGPTAGGHCVEAAYRNGDGIGRRAVGCVDIHSQSKLGGQSKLGVVVKSVRDNRELIRTSALFAATCDAVKSTVPQEMWGEIIEKLEELEQHPDALDVGTDSFDEADDEPFDPTEFIDRDDEF